MQAIKKLCHLLLLVASEKYIIMCKYKKKNFYQGGRSAVSFIVCLLSKSVITSLIVPIWKPKCIHADASGFLSSIRMR